MALSVSSRSTDQPVFALVAGELSGDTLGADLMQGLLARHPNARFVGIGGPKMQALGLESWADMSQLSIMGFAEVIKHLPKLLKLRAQLAAQIIALKPDAFIGIDAPDFNLGLAKKLKQAGLVTVHYVSPSIWAWRPKRIHKIKASVSGMLVLFPFEEALYQQQQIPVACVGHPLAKQVPNDPDDVSQIHAAKASLGMSDDQPIMAVLPGSRLSEVTTMAPIYLDTLLKLHPRFPAYQFVIPCVNQRIYELLADMLAQQAPGLPISLVQMPAQPVLQASDLVLVTSGTATLETALMARPMIIAIKVHPVSYWIMKRMALLSWVGLPNILAQQTIVPEFIQDEARADKLALALGQLLVDEQARASQRRAFYQLKDTLTRESGQLAAQAVCEWAGLATPVERA
ncbi:lipid-A-disaccharide synthase [Thiomicrospira aerophila AL3]|uniref:Lipid-A-disaccharide synthase n=1 Tax=Thiomicrospira aerophila AL3 TaxID=717772 RepID=W0DW21_9GAMM|nr:lipid-A-disaccharide synthase [Thiomicrospira aerophila]AHF01081.1 lipid-A-disaccharide synthase [Thiomicrospira aerophila AL3]